MRAPTAGGWRPALAAALAVAALVGALWAPLHERLALLPTDDLYTHLSVARHLARGEGFRTDIAYPLSFAWPCARTLPQPLVHRPPGWPIVLLLPYHLGGGDAGRAVSAVRALQIGLLALLAGLGTFAWLRRGRPGAAAAFLPALLLCPLLPFSVDWGQTELAAGALLLAAWLRRRDGTAAPAWIDGLLAGALALLRPELAWLPFAWALVLTPAGTTARAAAAPAAPGAPATARATAPAAPAATRPASGHRRGWTVALLAFVVVTAPWAVRNLRLAGDPFFSVQASAELVKDTRPWPGYEVYRQLEPQPFWRALRQEPAPIARKTARGLRFFAREWPGLVAWPLPLLLAVGGVVGARRNAAARRRWLEPAAVALLSFAALALLYAPLDHSLRHLLPLVPIVAWEAAPWLGEWPLTLRRGRDANRPAARSALAALAGLAIALPLCLLTAREPAGWSDAARAAAAAQPAVHLETERLRRLPPDEVPFVETAAAPWFADRAAVWSPADARVADRIRAWLNPSTAAAPGGRR